MPVHVPDQGNARLFRMRRRAQLGRTGPAEAIEESGLTDLDKKPMQRMPGLHQRFRQADRSAFHDHPHLPAASMHVQSIEQNVNKAHGIAVEDKKYRFHAAS